MDGGYYAIKGFEYQVDKSILEVLSCNWVFRSHSATLFGQTVPL